MTHNLNEMSDVYPSWAWFTAALLCIVFPPLGIFIIAAMFVGAAMEVEE